VGIVGNTGFIGSLLSTHPGVNCAFGLNSKDSTRQNLNKLIEGSDSIVLAGSSINPANASLNMSKVQSELDTLDYICSYINKLDKKVHLHLISSAGSLYVKNESILSDYATFKLKQEIKILNYFTNYTIYRISNVYGPTQRLGRSLGVINEWVNQIIHNGTILHFGDLSIKKDYIFIDDVINLLGKSLQNETNGLFNVGFGKLHTLGNVISVLQDLGPPFEIISQPRKSYDNSTNDFSIDLTVKTFEWFPKITLEKGVSLMLKYQLGENTQHKNKFMEKKSNSHE